jgi:exonuclease VII large subunit
VTRKSVAILLVAWFVTGPLAAPPALAGRDEKALQRAMEQQRKAAESEMRRQADSEKKMVEQQNRAMQAQMNAERKMVEMQQKAIHDQQKAIQNQQKANQTQHTTAGSVANPSAGHPASSTHSAPHITTTQTSTPVYHAARPYYGHSHGHAYHRTVYHNYRTMPTQQLDPRSRALLRLKASLDHVRMGSPATSAETIAIKRALMGVVNVPRVPTLAAIQSLSNRLADGLANRGSSSARTGPMALTLMGALNCSELANIDVTEIMNEHRAALKNSKVRPTEITAIMESLKTVANQERSRR